MTPTVTFVCSICAEPSQTICVYCTKDACANHLCERCRRCSDCCECEVRLEEPLEHELPVIAPELEPIRAESAAVEEPAAAESPLVETAILEEEEVGLPEPAAAEPLMPDEEIAIPEPVIAAVPPPPLSHPDLSKLFAPEHAPSRVFPITHGPVPVSTYPAEDLPEPDESSEPESSEEDNEA